MRGVALIGVLAVALLSGAGGAVGASTGTGLHSIIVLGQGSVRTVPDRAQISLGVSTDGKTASSALRANNGEIAKVIAAVKAQGIDAGRHPDRAGLPLAPL